MMVTFVVLFLLFWILIMSLECFHPSHKVGAGISIIIPFECNDKESQRFKNFEWVVKYWRCQLPGAEVIQGHDPDKPFSKSVAVNDSVAHSTGDILVIIDADGYITAKSALVCAMRIRHARRRGHRLWFIPYRQFYRLTMNASQRVLNSDPCNPYTFPTPPDPNDIQNTSGSQHGHWFGAMVQIWPREAFDEVGGWDERFRGWGGEDHAIMRACDTLYWPHKTLPGQALHLWHPMLSTAGVSAWVPWEGRMWESQTEAGANDELNGRYYGANGDRTRMRRLVDEGRRNKETLMKRLLRLVKSSL